MLLQAFLTSQYDISK